MIYFVGPNITSWGKALQKQAENEGIDDRIKFIGRTLNAMQYIYAADVFILPSHAEALPRTVLEAMALGTPVVATDVDGIPELIEDQKSGLMLQPGDIEGLINNITTLADSPDNARRLSGAACDRYWSNFSREHQVLRFTKVFNDIIKN